MPTGVAMAVVGLFAVFDGRAHGTELPLNGAPVAFAAGFVIATTLLHAVGIALSLAIKLVAIRSRARATRAVGAAIALYGLTLFA